MKTLQQKKRNHFARTCSTGRVFSNCFWNELNDHQLIRHLINRATLVVSPVSRGILLLLLPFVQKTNYLSPGILANISIHLIDWTGFVLFPFSRLISPSFFVFIFCKLRNKAINAFIFSPLFSLETIDFSYVIDRVPPPLATLKLHIHLKLDLLISQP